MQTKVGRHKVEVKNYEFPSIVTFSSGEKGKREKGHYCFWTAVVCYKGKRKRIWGRSRIILPPGDRFDRMKKEMITATDKSDRRIYKKYYTEFLAKGENIKYIRPSTIKEICKWCDSHESDAKYITECMVKGEEYELY